MSILLPSERDQRLVEGAVASSEPLNIRPVLFIGPLEIGYRITEGEWGQTEIPLSIDLSIMGRIPKRLENDEIRMYMEVEGVLIPQMVGVNTRFDPEDDRIITNLLSASAGSLLPRTRLRKAVEFFGDPPETLLREAISRVGYDQSQVQITPLGRPILSFYDDEGFKGEESAGDIVSRVQEQTTYLLLDTVQNGFVARPDTGLRNMENLPVIYEASKMETWSPARVEEYYSEVVVFREDATGEGFAFDPISALVEYKGLDTPAHRDLALWIPLNDETAEAADNAAALAYDEATLLGLSTHEGETRLPSFSPLISLGDKFGVHENYRDDDGTWDVLWGCRVRDFKHEYEAGDNSSGAYLQTTLNFDSTILEADLIDVPALIVPGPSGGVRLSLFSAMLERGLLAREVPGGAIELEASGRYFDPDESDSEIVVDETGLWVEVS